MSLSTKFAGKCGIFLAAVLLFLTSCSGDTNQQKLKFLKSGEDYFKQNRFQEAVIQFRNALQIDPRFAEAHYQLARSYLSLRNSNAAYRELTETVTLDPKNSAAQLQLAALLIASRQFEQAEAAAKKVLVTDPKNAKAHTILAAKYAMTGRPGNAIAEYQKAIDLDPNQPEYYESLGAIYVSTGEVPLAEETYKKATEANPKSIPAQMALAQFYFSQRDLFKAEALMRAVTQRDPRAVPPRLLLARIYIAESKLTEAEQLYSQLKALAPEDPLAYQALGLFYKSTGHKEKAVAEFRSVLEAKSKDVAVTQYLVETLIDLNQTKEAATRNDQILRSNPEDPGALISKGRILVAEAKYQEASSVLQQA